MPGEDATLAHLTVNERTINSFNSDDIEYRISVSHETSSITLGASSTDEYATIYGTGKHSFSANSRTFTLVVVAKDGIATKSYSATVIRRPSKDAALADLMIDGETVPGFGFENNSL